MSRRRPRIVYLQYTNPAGYPPLEHSSRILAGRGWDVLFFGTGAFGADGLAFPAHPAIEVRRMADGGSGLKQRLNYLAFMAWAVATCLKFRPDWVYASEALSCPAALAIRNATGCRVVYHEHDTPGALARPSGVQRIVRAARLKLARGADLCILPQQKRLAAFVAETRRTGPTECVWNCPRREEVVPPRPALTAGEPLTFYYHGSLNAERLPISIIEALHRASATAKLAIVGYETAGSIGYMTELLGTAARLGLGGRVRYLGPIAQRADMMTAAATADVGLAFMPMQTCDINMGHMTGASNKPFDYLALGQMLLVSDLPDWREMFVDPGYGRACIPFAVDDLSRALSWCAAHPDAVRAMGEAGRQRVLAEWNYERCFAGVVERLAPTTLGLQS